MNESNESPNPQQMGSLLTCPKSENLTEAQQRQRDRELAKRDEFINKKQQKDTQYEQMKRGSQSRTSKGLLQTMVPAVAWWLENHYEFTVRRNNNVGTAAKHYLRLRRYLKPEMMAHIALTTVLDSMGRGTTFKTMMLKLKCDIDRHLDDQAMLEYFNECDPYYFSKLQKQYLHDPVRRYDKKVYAMEYAFNQNDSVTYTKLTNKEEPVIGGLLLRAIMSVPADPDTKENFFEARYGRGSKKDAATPYLGLSKTGVKYRDKLQAAADALEFKPLPMVCEPLPWSLEKRGGYIIPPPREYQNMIHSHNPTIPSQTAIDALNRLQKIPYRINTYILDLQQHLLKSTHKIGCFRTYESDSWKDEHFPLVDSEWLATLDKKSPEYKAEMRKLTKAYQQQKLDEKEGASPRRVALQAEELRNEVFYTPWFFDSRLRLYPVCELGVTRGDFVKALLVNANPLPITKNTRKELLIAIATSGDFDKISKGTYEERLAWAENFVKSANFEMNVLYPESSADWREADEPFQFLAYCEEYYSLFVSKTRDTTRVFIGRDMSCSGIQFLSSLIGDEKAMAFTNVIPSDRLMDAYGEVARIARELLTDKKWLRQQLDAREEKRLKHNAAFPDRPKAKRMRIELDINAIDRSVVKTQVMVTGYGGTYLSKREYIIEQLKELSKKKGKHIHKDDYGIIVNACIQGMAQAFPKYTELNDWFKTVATAACKAGNEHISWISPNGSYIAQDYREPQTVHVKTYAANGGHYMKLLSDDYQSVTIQTSTLR